MHTRILLLVVSMLLVSCTPSLPNLAVPDAATAQTAVEDRLRTFSDQGPIINLTVRRIERVPDGAVALVTYDTEKQGAPARATGVLDLHRQGLGWTSTGGSTGVLLNTDPPPAFGHIGSGSGDNNTYSHDSGLCR